MDVTKPYKLLRFGAMDVTNPYKFIRFGAMDVTKSYKFIRFGAMDVTKTCKFIGPWMSPKPIHLYAIGARAGGLFQAFLGPIWARKGPKT